MLLVTSGSHEYEHNRSSGENHGGGRENPRCPVQGHRLCFRPLRISFCRLGLGFRGLPCRAHVLKCQFAVFGLELDLPRSLLRLSVALVHSIQLVQRTLLVIIGGLEGLPIEFRYRLFSNIALIAACFRIMHERQSSDPSAS